MNSAGAFSADGTRWYSSQQIRGIQGEETTATSTWREREAYAAKQKPVNTMELRRGVSVIFKVPSDHDYQTPQLAKEPGFSSPGVFILLRISGSFKFRCQDSICSNAMNHK